MSSEAGTTTEATARTEAALTTRSAADSPAASAAAGSVGARADPVRVAITPDAAAVLRRLRGMHGALMFHQSGGCCDGSSPMCYPRGDFIVGDDDVLLGLLDDAPIDADSPGRPAPYDAHGDIPTELTPVWISGSQYAAWKHTQLLLDVVPGRGGGFSVEAPEGVRFLTRSRVFDAAEREWVEACPAPRGRDFTG